MKKVLSIVLCTVMLLSLFVVSTSAAAWDGTTVSTSLKGEGTADKPYLVETAADLAYLAKAAADGESFAGKYLTQTADIDLGGKEWTPIGVSGKAFSGVYDGKNFKITGLKITKAANNFVGLFGFISATADKEAGIANVNLEGEITIDALGVDAGVGGLVAWVYKDANDGFKPVSVINCTVDVDVTLTNCAKQPRVGGTFGYAFLANIENVVNNGDVSVSGTGSSRVGGLVGQTNRTHYLNCVNNGNVTTDVAAAQTARAGGITSVITRGGAAGDEANAVYTVFENCVNNGKVYTKGQTTTYAAGIAADFYANATNWPGKDIRVKFINCINNGSVTSETTNNTVYPHAGGLGGYTYGSGDEVHANGCVNTATEIKSLGGKQDRSGGMYGSVYSPNVTSAETFKIENCISVGSVKGGCFSLKDAATALDTCTSDADAATIKKAVDAITAKMVPSVRKIAGFDTAYKAPVVPDPTPTPNPGTGDVATLLVVMAIISLAGVVVAKKVSAR